MVLADDDPLGAAIQCPPHGGVHVVREVGAGALVVAAARQDLVEVDDPGHAFDVGRDEDLHRYTLARTLCQKWHATKCSSSISSSTGATSRERSSAKAHRV